MEKLLEIEKILENKPELGKLLFSSEILDELNKIAESSKIDEDVYSMILEEIAYVVLGLTDKNYFVEIIQGYGVDKKTAELIYRQSESSIFSKINDIKNNFINKSNYLEKNGGKEKIDEISKKYGLSDSQKNTLNLICKEILSDLSKKEALLVDLDKKLDASKILSEQIIEDLEKRIFNPSVKIMENKKPVDSQQKKPEIKTSLEIKPTNLPMIEEGEVAHDTKITIKTPEKPAPSSINWQNSVETPVNPVQKPVTLQVSSITKEVVQEPVPVPRFIAENTEEKEDPVVKPENHVVNLMEMVDKKTPPQVNPSVAPTTEQKPKEETPIKKIFVDPYREPIE